MPADAGGILFGILHQRHDGTRFPVEVSARGAHVGGERLILSIICDISSRETASDPVGLIGDAGRLEQVVENLLSNAIKYSPDGGQVTLTLAADGAGWRLTVSDEGIGLPPGATDRIFEPFGRARNATALHLPGMGLGLAISKGIIERHGAVRVHRVRAGAGQVHD